MMKHEDRVVATPSGESLELSWRARLGAAHTPDEVAQTIVALVQARVDGLAAAVLWRLEDPDGQRRTTGGACHDLDWRWLVQVGRVEGPQWHPSHDLAAIRLCEQPLPTVLLLRRNAGALGADLFEPLSELLRLAGAHLRRALEWSQLQRSHQRLERSEALQRALFAISDLAGSERAMPDMLRGIHAIISALMYAENFFIVLHDRARESIRFLHYVDLQDPVWPGDGQDMPLSAIEYTLTWYVIRDGKPRMGDAEELRHQAPGPVRLIGTDSYDWLGVPMLRDGQVGGALVVQSYRQDASFSESDLALLQFVSSHILTALERKQSNEDMEQRVQLRTLQLADANHGLQLEVLERKRAEHLQSALFQLARLATEDIDENAFYERIHVAVGGLLDAKNFFIALLDEDRCRLDFPYYADAGTCQTLSRPLGRGLSEFVLRHGKTLLVGATEIEALYQSGELVRHEIGEPAVCWLGVPLWVGEEVIGLVAVQSYAHETSYDAADQKLLGFVALQIANSIYRRRAAASLQRANLQLEQRVEERTLALRNEIVERQRAQEQLKHQLMHDSLTGLPNRTHLRERMACALALARQQPQQQCALLYLDLDRFKVVNDSLGHLAGDEVLKLVATRLADCVRDPDLVARLSGDEFAILLARLACPDDAAAVAQRVLQALAAPMLIAGKEIQTSASIGVAIGDKHHEDADEILRDADIALYRAKQLGRKRFEWFDETLARNAIDVLAMEGDLRRALQGDQFEPYFQRLCRLDSGELVGYEALIRWNHPQRGVLLPGDFLQIAEDCGLVEAIDWRMFELSCEALLRHGQPDTFLTLNVSALHLRHREFDTRLIAMLERVGVPPARLVVEVTEGSLLDNPAQVRATLDRLRSIGVGAALDDFGTGYSSLSYLHSLPLRILKIDRAFVHELDRGADSSSTTVVAAILALARALDIQVIAEGIETPMQHAALRAMGCEMGQGYLLGRPAPMSDRSPVAG